jgi:hypothetical protein
MRLFGKLVLSLPVILTLDSDPTGNFDIIEATTAVAIYSLLTAIA